MTTTARSTRIETLRERWLAAGGFRGDPEKPLLSMRGWLQAADATSVVLRRARAKAHVLRNITPTIEPGELIVGRTCQRALTPEEEAELQRYRNESEPAMMRVWGQGAHMAVDFPKLLALGTEGVLADVRRRLDALDEADPASADSAEFYRACAEVLRAAADASDRYADEAERLAAAAADPDLRDELTEIARICRKVPRRPAETFHEALQSAHFLVFCLMNATFQAGRPDRYLAPFYRRDVEAGRLTPERAQELVDCFCLQFNQRAGPGTSLGLMIGGRDADGRDVANELTELFLESIPHTRLSYPSVGLCLTADTPPRILRRACEILASGCTHPALFNDEVITRGLRAYGLPPDEACDYIHSSCVEITPVASSGVWVASPYHSLAGYLLETLDQAPDCTSFDQLKTRYRETLARHVRQGVIDQNRRQAGRARTEEEELLAACFVHDCLERGRSIDAGGARYNWIMPSFVGLANLVDSLVAIRTLVFEEKRLSLSELTDILRRDFQGDEPLRCEIANRLPRYGNDQPAADALAAEVTDWLTEECARYTTFRGDRFIPSLFCWIMHERIGSETAATPDGRHAGQALADGAGAAQGRDRTGPTAAVLSATAWNHTPFIGGIAVNMKFSKTNFTPESIDKMSALVRTFLQRGGFELQVNVVDRDTLRRARENPEAYRDLVVRIGGYSDYFTALSPEMQNELIRRTEHEL
jgi:formate C-acetyltransferase